MTGAKKKRVLTPEQAEAARVRAREAYARKKARMASDPDYREAERKKAREYQRSRRAENPESYREADRRHREANRDERNAAARQRRAENLEFYRQRDREWRERNLEQDRARCREYQRRRRREMPEVAAQREREWRESNPLAVWEGRLYAKAKRAGVTADRADRRLVREWLEIIQNDPCSYSRERVSCEHVDHIVPLKEQGEHSWENLTSASASQNRRKQGMPLLIHLLRELEVTA